MSIHIRSIGKALPQKRVSNEQLPASLETSDEWIRSHTGIGSRYLCAENESSSSLGALAAKNAIERANQNGDAVAIEEIGLIVCATASADYWSFPSNACLIQKALGAVNACAFDLSAACSGFIYGLQTARCIMKQMNYKYALVIGAEALSRITDWSDRSTCVLFGDGAGCALLENKNDGAPDCFGSFELGADGTGDEALYLDKEKRTICMDGRAVYNFAVGKMTEIIKNLMQKDNLTIDDVDLIVCHQANERIIQAAAKRLGYPMDKFAVTLTEYANTSSSSIPIALADLVENGKLKKGMKILTAGFGAGLTWGGCTLTW